MWLIILITLAVIAIVAVCALVFRHKSRPPPNVYIVGLQDSGKTNLFTQLVFKETFSTVTSQRMNTESVNITDKKSINLIDMPGHPRIRTQLFNSIKNADGVIFLIDSVDVIAKINHIATFLYDLLSVEDLIKRKVPFLIAGTKTDREKVRDIDYIREELESEMDQVRDTKKKTDLAEAGGADYVFLGDENVVFAFDQLVQPITFTTISAKTGQIKGVEEFLHHIAH